MSILVLAGAAVTACGSRVDEAGTRAAPVVPTTAALATSTTAPRRDVTKSVPVASSAASAALPVPSSAVATTRTPTTNTPATSAPVASSGPAVGGSATTVSFDKAGFCAASKVYAIDDLLGLGTRVVGDPAGLLRAYETMVDSAPSDLAAPVQKLGPITREAVGLVQRGEITTPERLQAWLADTAPRAELEQWVLAQQTIAPVVKDRCG